MIFDELIIWKSLEKKSIRYGDSAADFIDRQIASGELQLAEPVFRNVCAQIPSDLASELDSICGFLGISKRLFVTHALAESVSRAHALMNQYEAFPPSDEEASK